MNLNKIASSSPEGICYVNSVCFLLSCKTIFILSLLDRVLGKKVAPEVIAGLMDNLAAKGFGRVVRKGPHAFFVIKKDFFASNYEQLGLEYKDVAAAMAKTSTLPKKFEYLIGI